MIQDQTFTTIGKQTQLQGTLKLEGNTHLYGSFNGELHIAKGAKLVLEIGSRTEGTIICENLEVYGEFSGQIKATGVVTLYPTSYVQGQILARSMEILPGAQVNINGHTEDL